MSQKALARLTARFPADVVGSHASAGDDTAIVRLGAWRAVADFLRADPDCAFDLPVDLTGVDHLPRSPRFELVVHLYSTRHRHRLRVKTALDDDAPAAPTLVPVWRGFEWFEREAWDLYGVRFEGHPDLRRVLLPETFDGHPLRKDYPKDRRQPLYRREADNNA